jgi:hypothetical protein
MRSFKFTHSKRETFERTIKSQAINQSIADQFNCAVCYKFIYLDCDFINCKQCTCICCQTCFAKIKKGRRKEYKNCPLCKGDFPDYRSKIISKTIRSLDMLCPYCATDLPLEAYEDHVFNCAFFKGIAICLWCNVKVATDNTCRTITEHLKLCPNKPLNNICDGCGDITSNLSRHQEFDCPNRTVTCAFCDSEFNGTEVLAHIEKCSTIILEAYSILKHDDTRLYFNRVLGEKVEIYLDNAKVFYPWTFPCAICGQTLSAHRFLIHIQNCKLKDIKGINNAWSWLKANLEFSNKFNLNATLEEEVGDSEIDSNSQLKNTVLDGVDNFSSLAADFRARDNLEIKAFLKEVSKLYPNSEFICDLGLENHSKYKPSIGPRANLGVNNDLDVKAGLVNNNGGLDEFNDYSLLRNGLELINDSEYKASSELYTNLKYNSGLGLNAILGKEERGLEELTESKLIHNSELKDKYYKDLLRLNTNNAMSLEIKEELKEEVADLDNNNLELVKGNPDYKDLLRLKTNNAMSLEIKE